MLKSGCYTLDSKKINLIDLKLVSNSLHDNAVTQLCKQIQDLIGPYDHVTYPGSTSFPRVPHELVDKDKASQVLSSSLSLPLHDFRVSQLVFPIIF